MSRDLLKRFGGCCGPVIEIDEKQVGNYVGQEVVVRGRVTQVAHDKGEVFICFGGQYPNQSFKGFIDASSPLAKDRTLSALAGKKLRIADRITEYNRKPEIVITSRSQILLK
jgi:hypothetical protein